MRCTEWIGGHGPDARMARNRDREIITGVDDPDDAATCRPRRILVGGKARAGTVISTRLASRPWRQRLGGQENDGWKQH